MLLKYVLQMRNILSIEMEEKKKSSSNTYILSQMPKKPPKKISNILLYLS